MLSTYQPELTVYRDRPITIEVCIASQIAMPPAKPPRRIDAISFFRATDASRCPRTPPGHGGNHNSTVKEQSGLSFSSRREHGSSFPARQWIISLYRYSVKARAMVSKSNGSMGRSVLNWVDADSSPLCDRDNRSVSPNMSVSVTL
jgi:hypothetical protein